MCLLDGIRDWDATRISCFATSHTLPDNPLRHRNQLSAQAGVEYAAQAMAAHAALAAGGVSGPRPGVLAVVSQLRWYVDRLDTIPTPLEVQAWRVASLPAGHCYGFVLQANGLRLLEGEVIVVAPRSADRRFMDSPSRWDR
jgi:predicted hotdog family 3-hydroxylacyl-ACP dehydratase